MRNDVCISDGHKALSYNVGVIEGHETLSDIVRICDGYKALSYNVGVCDGHEVPGYSRIAPMWCFATRLMDLSE